MKQKFVQNKLRVHNSPSMTKAKSFSIRPDSIQQNIQMNVV
jgi:hypothetical protein